MVIVLVGHFQKSELLPKDWNDFETAKDFVYYKQDTKVQLEIIKETDLLNFIAKVSRVE